MQLSVVIPARDEAGSITETVEDLLATLRRERIPFEVLVVDDGSQDDTRAIVERIAEEHAEVRLLVNPGPNGFGWAVRTGLGEFRGDAVAIMMADRSDSPLDLVRYYRKLQEGHECVFGSRFLKGGGVVDYPLHKLLINRLANWFIKVIFRLPYNDTTNAFKCYRREVIDGLQPLIAPHFNLTVELPLKAIIRGYSYTIIPITWTNRQEGLSKLRIREMGSRYLFIVLYLWLEKHFSRGDYHRVSSEVRHFRGKTQHV